MPQIRTPISFRLPPAALARLDALAADSGLSRTAMLERLIQAADAGRPADELGRAIAGRILSTLAGAIADVGAIVSPGRPAGREVAAARADTPRPE